MPNVATLTGRFEKAMRCSALSHQITARDHVHRCILELRLTGQMTKLGSPFDMTKSLQVGHTAYDRSFSNTTLCHKTEGLGQKAPHRLFSVRTIRCHTAEEIPPPFCSRGRHFDALNRQLRQLHL